MFRGVMEIDTDFCYNIQNMHEWGWALRLCEHCFQYFVLSKQPLDVVEIYLY